MNINQKLKQLDGAVGFWWLSTSPDTRHPGVLRRNADLGTWRLSTYGNLLGAPRMGLDSSDNHGEEVDDSGRIFGTTIEGDVTLPMASRLRQRLARFEREEDWQAFTVLVGIHAEPEQIWTVAEFDLPYIWDWFSPTVSDPPGPDYIPPLDKDFEWTSAAWNDFTITAWRHTVRTSHRRTRSATGRGGFTFHHSRGFTLDDVEKPILALQNLYDILYGELSTPEGLILTPAGATPGYEVLELPARCAIPSQKTSPEPYFGTAEIDFASFIPAWIALHLDAQVWPSIGSPPGAAGWLQTQLVESVNAAEALALQLFPNTDNPTTHEQDILQAISALPKKTRKYAKRALKIARATLAQRLERLALTIGSKSAKWLLGDVRSWATVLAQTRNALSHGFRSTSALETDPHALWLMLTSVKAVQQLSMLRAAGFTNGQIGQVELLFGSDKLIQHPNSALAQDLEHIHNTSKVWVLNTEK